MYTNMLENTFLYNFGKLHNERMGLTVRINLKNKTKNDISKFMKM